MVREAFINGHLVQMNPIAQQIWNNAEKNLQKINDLDPDFGWIKNPFYLFWCGVQFACTEQKPNLKHSELFLQGYNLCWKVLDEMGVIDY